jgi:hypothetical protein
MLFFFFSKIQSSGMKTIIKHKQHTLMMDTHGVQFKVAMGTSQHSVWMIPWIAMSRLCGCLHLCVERQHHGYKLFEFPDKAYHYKLSTDAIFISISVLSRMTDIAEDALFEFKATYSDMHDLLSFIEVGKGIYGNVQNHPSL